MELCWDRTRQEKKARGGCAARVCVALSTARFTRFWAIERFRCWIDSRATSFSIRRPAHQSRSLTPRGPLSPWPMDSARLPFRAHSRKSWATESWKWGRSRRIGPQSSDRASAASVCIAITCISVNRQDELSKTRGWFAGNFRALGSLARTSNCA